MVTSLQNFGGAYDDNFIYDEFGRVTYHGAHGVSTNMQYNDQDQLLYKDFDNGLQRQDYSYNSRGWLTNINLLVPEVLREDRTTDPTDEFCEDEMGEDETYVIYEEVPPSEFFDLLCSGEQIGIPGLDSCFVGNPPEEECLTMLYDYTLTISTSKTIKLVKEACEEEYQQAIGSVNPGPFNIDAIYINSQNYLSTIPLNYPYSYSSTSPDPVEQQRLIDDLSNWLSGLSDVSYPFDEVYILHPQWGDFTLRITGTDFSVFSAVQISRDGACYTPGIPGSPVGNDYLGDAGFSIQEYFTRTDNREVSCKLAAGELPPGPQTETGSSKPGVYPTKLYEIVLDGDKKDWHYAHELAAIQGDYTIYKEIKVNSQNALFTITDQGKKTKMVTMAELDLLLSNDAGIFTITVTDQNDPPKTCIPIPAGCDVTIQQQQQASLATLCAQTIQLFEDGTITYPANISFIQLCDGSYTYVLTEVLGSLTGGYNILDEYTIAAEDNLIGVEIRQEEARFAMQFKHQPNGNIEQMKWKISNRATSVYDFVYDPLDRVTQADYGEEYYWEEIITPSVGDPYISRQLIQSSSAEYSTGYTYDGAGNIETIWRNGLGSPCLGPDGKIDDMTLTYGGLGGQQLMSVQDAAAPNLRPFGFKPHDSVNHGTLQYTYDDNGNMTYDPHKELDVIYNFLNLPKQANGPQSGFSTIYDATGRKWKKESTFTINGQTATETRIYAGAIEFEQTGTTPMRLSSINGHEDGRSVQVYSEGPSAEEPPPGGDIQSRVEYYHKDHLGNVRLSFSDLDQDGTISVGSIYDASNEIMMEKHYYPFGLEQTGAWFATVVPDNDYRYNGKELDEATGWYDYQARYFDPAIGRFINVDPLADQFAPWSPYSYGYDNPIRFTDPDGMAAEDCCGGGNGMAWIAEGFRQYFQAAGQAVDNLKAKFSIARRSNVTTTTLYEDGVNKAASESYTEVKQTTTASTNFASLFDPGNYANTGDETQEYQGPSIVETTESTTSSVVAKSAVSTKIEGLDLKLTGQTTIDVNTGETTMTGKGQIGISNNAIFIEGSNLGNTKIGVQLEHKQTEPDKTQTVYSFRVEYMLSNGG